MDVLKRLKFWIGLGLLVVASGVVLGVWFLPARKENSQLAEKWDQEATAVQGMIAKDVAPRGQAQVYEERAKEVAAARERLLGTLTRSDVDISAPIPDPETGVAQEGLESGIWKLVYEKAMRALDRDVKRMFVEVKPARLVRMKEFPGIWPTAQEVTTETRSYWIQRYILEALGSVNGDQLTAPCLSEFEFTSEPERLLAPSDADAYLPQGFRCVLEAEFTSIPFIIDQLMDCPIPISITTLEVQRPEDVLEKIARSGVVREKALVEGDVVGGRPAGGAMPFGGPPAGVGGPPAGVGGPGGPPPGFMPTGMPRGMPTGMARGRPTGPGAGRAGRRTTRRGRGQETTDEEAGLQVKARHIPTRLVEVTIAGYANVPRPPKKAEAETESENS
jgi:hypothetical protein